MLSSNVTQPTCRWQVEVRLWHTWQSVDGSTPADCGPMTTMYGSTGSTRDTRIYYARDLLDWVCDRSYITQLRLSVHNKKVNLFHEVGGLITTLASLSRHSLVFFSRNKQPRINNLFTNMHTKLLMLHVVCKMRTPEIGSGRPTNVRFRPIFHTARAGD